MRLFLLLFALAIPSFSAPATVYLASGEEFEGILDSLHSKQAEFVLPGNANRLVPYGEIVAIRIDGRLKTGRFDRIELEKLFPDLPAGSRLSHHQPENSSTNRDLELRSRPTVGPEGHYLTFQGIQSLFNLRPTMTMNYFWAAQWAIHPTLSLCFENWTSRHSPDTSFQGEMYGLGIKGGGRKYFRGNQKWYLEGDMGVFHFFNGMVGGDRSYFSLGPFIGYQNLFETIVVDVNIGWMHVLNEPQVIPDIPDASTRFGNLDRAIDLQIQSMESTVKVFYPYMRLEANFALGLKF